MSSLIKIFLIGALLSSCGTSYWASKTKPINALEEDIKICHRQASLRFPPRIHSRVTPDYHTSASRSEAGTTVTVTPHFNVDPRDINEVPREKHFQQCMMVAGWTRETRGS